MMTIQKLAALLVLCTGCAATAPTPPATGRPTTTTAAVIENDGPPRGSAAPNFVGPASDGTTLSLSTMRGRTVVLWFFGRAETPNAVREAEDFRDAFAKLNAQGVLVVGVSTDTLAAQEAFAKRLRLPYPLIADPQGSIARAYGVPTSYGVSDRRTFIIGASGTVEKIYRTVNVEKHVREVVREVF